MNIVNIGHVLIDENSSESASYIAAGGVTIFMQKIFSKLPDVNYTIVSHWGKDFQQYTQDLNLFPPIPDLEFTPRYVNISRDGLREQKATRREGGSPVAVDVNLKKVLIDADIVIVSPLFPTFSTQYIREVMAAVNKNAVTLLLPQGYYREFDENDNVIKRDFLEENEIISQFNFMIVSEQDSKDIENDISKWLVGGDTIFVVTRGEKGCSIVSKYNAIDVSGEVVEEKDIIDSVGSGDIFSAAFIYKMKKSDSLEESARFANSVAKECLFYTPDQLNTVKLKFLVQ